MQVPTQKILIITIAIVLAAFATFAMAQPGPTACLLVGVAGLSEYSNRTLFTSETRGNSPHLLQITSDARNRIENVFGRPESAPMIVFLDNSSRIGPFKLNTYGSTQFVGSRTCVMVGPQGRNIDVVAHELMHAELSQRVGHLNYLLEVPTWFDEGVAMQVDYRSRYSPTPEVAQRSGQVLTLTTGSSFFVADDDALTFNYASAKHEVAIWLSQVGTSSLYRQLARMKAGESFSEIYTR
jgi:hypothetical protein